MYRKIFEHFDSILHGILLRASFEVSYRLLAMRIGI